MSKKKIKLLNIEESRSNPIWDFYALTFTTSAFNGINACKDLDLYVFCNYDCLHSFMWCEGQWITSVVFNQCNGLLDINAPSIIFHARGQQLQHV